MLTSLYPNSRVRFQTKFLTFGFFTSNGDERRWIRRHGIAVKGKDCVLGTQIDDFIADAIVSQLLLLDAQDPTKDIRLFINSTGGSLRLGIIFIAFIIFNLLFHM